MNWKLIFQLSIFGLIMAFGTVSLIPQKVEPVFWVLIFAFCAAVIAKACNGKFFLYGFYTGLVNCVWITVVHFLFYKKYIESHNQLDSILASLPPSFSTHPRVATALVGLIPGVISALIFGVFAFLGAKIAPKR
ncbi:MAG: hypothetical protein ACTHMI_19335 [Mucilaginibacter sp.]|uniref:hypothetical protein n=1 Tax=Mucilaginibacter sp. L3T2-6 TaxID=3062491 RepID=UPI0026763F98|nr:hypothetical protein [Mucilaginibacter sp. L3T2-6]MDO3641786.1 hypothetical protein [Mucilaginibacter sp. L3T2-6]MDV6214536.1 hypothetical protein [Mucilaginibacter sp. L3T2-6]